MQMLNLMIAVAVFLLGIFPAVGTWLTRGWVRKVFGILLALWFGFFCLVVIALMPSLWPNFSAEKDYVEAVNKAIEEGKTEVPLKDLTKFEWRAVCWIGHHDPYHEPYEKDRQIVKEATGEDVLDTNLADEGAQYFIFGTPRGALMMYPPNYNWVVKGYNVRLVFSKMAPGMKTSWEPLCYLPEQAKVFIEKR